MNMHDRYDSELIMYDQMPANSKSTTPVTKQMMVAGKIHHQDLKRFDYNSMIKNSIETSVERTVRCSIGSGQGLMSKTMQTQPNGFKNERCSSHQAQRRSINCN